MNVKYYLDTEFDGFGGTLISLALAREDGQNFYVVPNCYPITDEWVKSNVVPVLFPVNLPDNVQGWYPHSGFKYYMHLGENIARFLQGDPNPHIICDWPDDIAYFCKALITGPGEMVNIPHLFFEVLRVDAYPTNLPGAIQHNALWDALALKHLIEEITNGVPRTLRDIS